MNTFKERLKEMRAEAGISQKDLANVLGVSDAAVCKWERGEAEPKVTYLIRLAEYFECTVDYLVGKTDDFGTSQSAETAPRVKLSKTEKRFIREYRHLTSSEKMLIFKAVNAWRDPPENDDDEDK